MSAGVLFNTVPGNTLVPFTYFEVNSGGTTFQGQPKLLLVGQKLSAGSAPAGVRYGPVQSERELIGLVGIGSMLVDMYRAARLNAPFQPIWILPLAEPAGAPAVGSLTFTTAPAVIGVGLLRVTGTRIPVQVLASDTTAQIATKVAAAINAANLVVTAAIDGGNASKVNITSRHNGTTSNNLDLTLPLDQNVFVGKTTVAALSGGTGVPALTAPLAALGDEEFDWIAHPYADATSLDAFRLFFSDVSGRWSPSKMLFGHGITAAYGLLSALVTLGNSRNDRHVSILGSQTRPLPVWTRAAMTAAIAVSHLGTAPELSRPLQGLEMVGDLPLDDPSLQFANVDRQALYVDGIAATRADNDGTVRIDRIVTTEQVDANGVLDATFRDIETLGQMMFVVRYFRTEISRAHGRQALADENPYGLQTIATPRSIRQTLIHAYEDLTRLGVLEKPELFAQYVIVERDPSDANRVNAYLPVDVVNQLRVFAGNVTTNLQYRTAA